MAEKTPVYAYFYPTTTVCPEKQQRASEYGVELVDETQLAPQTQPLFEGHDQPQTYCLGDASITSWDDADPEAMLAHIELAQSHGVDGFIFDSYVGEKNGKRVHEAVAPLDDAFLGLEASRDLKFAIMAALSSPRAVLPVSANPNRRERGRIYDYSKGTAEAIIDNATKYWEHGNYIRMPGDRPYLSLYFNKIHPLRTAPEDARLTVLDMIDYMKMYSKRRYRIVPYIAGVCLKSTNAPRFAGSSADALTGYSLLPDFSPAADPIQDFTTRLEQTITDWGDMAYTSDKPFVPPVVVGWDASPRAEPGYDIESLKGVHPFTPVVTGSGEATFARMLYEQNKFVNEHVPPEERYTPITSWNEVSEGSALLPRRRPDGTVDSRYLAMISLGAYRLHLDIKEKEQKD